MPLHERAALANVAIDVIFDSVSVTTTYKKKLGVWAADALKPV